VEIRPAVVLLSAWALFLIGLLNTAATGLLLLVALLGDPQPFLEVSIGAGLLAFWFLAAGYVLRYGREQEVTDLTIGRMLGALIAATRR